VAGVATGLVILAGGAAALLTFSPDPVARTVADDCGLVACGAHLPSSATGLSVRSTPQASHSGRPGHRPAPSPSATTSTGAPTTGPTPDPSRPGRSPTPGGPSPSPSATSPGPQLTVSYALNRLDTAHPGFKAQLTIVNNGPKTVAGWTLDLSLPSDVVTWVGYPGATGLPFTFWQFSGGTLTLHAVSSGEALRPGSTEVVPFDANGTATVPASCTFNGSACIP
jgi:hypothetical protein